MVCTTCQRDPDGGPLCAACGAIQPFRPHAGLFEVVGLPRSAMVAPAALEERYRDLSRKLHPDRFAQRGPAERKLSLEWTTLLNEAYRTLKDPLRRATYLLKLHGVDVERESGKSAMQRLPPEFLEEVLDLREALEGAKAAKDLDRVRAMARQVEGRAADVQARLADALGALEAGGGKPALDRAGDALAALRYFTRFQEEVEAIEMAALE